MNLYRMELDFGRMGCVEALFIATEEEVKSLEGKRSYFGEILGKHSEVWMDWNNMNIPVHITKLDVSEKTVAELLSNAVGRTVIGYNPLEWFEDEYEGN